VELNEQVRSLADRHLIAGKAPRFRIGDMGDSQETETSPTPLRQSSQEDQTPSAEEEDQLALREILRGRMKHRDLESRFEPARSVAIRRRYIERLSGQRLQRLPHADYDYSMVNGACCENIIGYVPIPTGVAGPLRMNGEHFYIPLATTEGALIASTNRGCRAIEEAGGVKSFVHRDGMSRAPVLQFRSAADAYECKRWIECKENMEAVTNAFQMTSLYAKLLRVDPFIEGKFLYLRFVATTGDAMGMNMVTKGTTEAIRLVQKHFPSATLESISGNMCVDKKASALNWIEGRGKSVVAEAEIPEHVVRDVLKTNVDSIARLATSKLHMGAANSVSIGGCNAHAANVVAAIFLATGQDAAQIVSSSMCSTQLSRSENGNLYISCTMNCLEVGTVGGGTILAPQQACLALLGCCGPSDVRPGENAERLAKVICSAVLAGELSLLASQCTGDLVRSHLRLNRSSRDLASSRSLASLRRAEVADSSIGDQLNHLSVQGIPSHRDASNSIPLFSGQSTAAKLFRKGKDSAKTKCSPL